MNKELIILAFTFQIPLSSIIPLRRDDIDELFSELIGSRESFFDSMSKKRDQDIQRMKRNPSIFAIIKKDINFTKISLKNILTRQNKGD